MGPGGGRADREGLRLHHGQWDPQRSLVQWECHDQTDRGQDHLGTGQNMDHREESRMQTAGDQHSPEEKGGLAQGDICVI